MANISKMREDLKDLEESVNELPEEFRDEIRDEIKILKQEIADAEQAESSKDKMKQEAEKKIEKLEKEVASPKTSPKVKEQVKKAIASVKSKVKEAVAEDKKERKEKYVPKAKKVVKAVSSGKRGRPKKVATPVKKVVKRKSKAEVIYSKALKSLNSIVNKTAELKAKYKGQGVDLEKDANRKAKPFGYRLRGNNYRRPTKAEIKSGEAYWEGRPNRADVKRTAYPKLEDGGIMDYDGDTTQEENYAYTEIYYNPNKKIGKPSNKSSFKHAYTVDIDGKVYSMSGTIGSNSESIFEGYIDDYSPQEIKSFGKKIMFNDAPKELVAQIHKVKGYKDGGYMAKGGRTKKRTKAEIIADKRYKALKAGKRIAESGEVYYESRPNRSDVSRRDRLEDGGMMKKGGRTKASIIADKRYKALKAGKRTSASGEVYYESRVNRSDVSRRDRI